LNNNKQQLTVESKQQQIKTTTKENQRLDLSLFFLYSVSSFTFFQV